MKNKIIISGAIFLLLIVSILFVILNTNSESKEDQKTTIEQSQNITQNYIKTLYPYQKLQGEEIVLLSKKVLECNSCYSFEYNFEINSQINPGQREKAKVEVIIENGIITNTIYSENLIINKIYCTKEQRNAEACTMEYAPVCGSDNNTYGNACTACSNPEVEYYIRGECA